MKYIKIIILFNLILFLYSCGTIKKGFINQKKNSSDEFLVEKKSPLIMPPDYSDLPIPKSEGNTKTKSTNSKVDNKIKELVSKNTTDDKKKEDVNQNFEESLLKKIKKN